MTKPKYAWFKKDVADNEAAKIGGGMGSKPFNMAQPLGIDGRDSVPLPNRLIKQIDINSPARRGVKPKKKN